jgi:hypothetical protein
LKLVEVDTGWLVVADADRLVVAEADRLHWWVPSHFSVDPSTGGRILQNPSLGW